VRGLNLDYARITSPVDGVTGVRLVDPGNVVHAADPGGIVVVTQLDPVAVLFNLPQDELPRISDQMAHGKLAVECTAVMARLALGKGRARTHRQPDQPGHGDLAPQGDSCPTRAPLVAQPVRQSALLLTTRKGALVVPASTLQRGPRAPSFMSLALTKP